MLLILSLALPMKKPTLSTASMVCALSMSKPKRRLIQTGLPYLAVEGEQAFLSWISTQTLPDGVRYRLRGANEESEEAANFLGFAMLASLILMFIILLVQFNSIYYTFLTLSTVVLSTVGVLLGMVITGQTFSVIMSGTGVVALAGIVVNNSIVLIDTYQRLLETGMDRVTAILKTAGQRLRPILLTTVTTMIGLFPWRYRLRRCDEPHH
ncbi:MAG: hypothetical protein CM15mP21_1660 [Hyphomicrobiales bacterium]|nr:MAG: hypothetical protein CM15mP21_1660 [Hyphomicrobiales bacterium]